VNERTMFMTVFLLITALTAVVVLGANVGFFGESVRTSDFAKWSVTAVIAEIVSATVVAFKWWFSPLEISVSLDFSPKEPFDIDLNADKCTYEVRAGGDVISGGKVAVALAEGGWQCTLPSTIKPNHIVSLNLEEKGGTKWEVRWFYPFAITKKPIARVT
jgi:hypothetical protein